jgi:hypothetical protein
MKYEEEDLSNMFDSKEERKLLVIANNSPVRSIKKKTI